MSEGVRKKERATQRDTCVHALPKKNEENNRFAENGKRLSGQLLLQSERYFEEEGRRGHGVQNSKTQEKGRKPVKRNLKRSGTGDAEKSNDHFFHTGRRKRKKEQRKKKTRATETGEKAAAFAK